MYAIEWLKDGALVEREISVMLHEADVVATTARRSYAVVARRGAEAPDSFRVTNAFGMEIGVFQLDGQAVATNDVVEPRSIMKVCGTLTPTTMLVA